MTCYPYSSSTQKIQQKPPFLDIDQFIIYISMLHIFSLPNCANCMLDPYASYMYSICLSVSELTGGECGLVHGYRDAILASIQHAGPKNWHHWPRSTYRGRGRGMFLLLYGKGYTFRAWVQG